MLVFCRNSGMYGKSAKLLFRTNADRSIFETSVKKTDMPRKHTQVEILVSSMQMVLNACRWVEAAGGHVTTSQGIEVSPLVSYGGEGLQQLCEGQTLSASFDSKLQVSLQCMRCCCCH